MSRGREAWRRRAADGPWLPASCAVAALVVAPLAALAAAASPVSAAHWAHLLDYVVPVAARDTLILLTGVGTVAAVLGTGTAWLVTAYAFPGRGVLGWALLLPLAVPTYIIAYAYLDLLHPVGPVQTALRAVLGIDSPRDFRLPDIRSTAGCIVLLGFVLYPYVYLTTRAMFLMQTANLLDAARTLGLSRRAAFLRVALPLALPAIVVGVTLALLETLNDIGASEFLGVRTLTVSIYATWVTRSDLAGAAQMALAMVAVVIALVALEWRLRGDRRYENEVRQSRPFVAATLPGWRGVGALCLVSLPVLIGFVFPAAYLVDAVFERLGTNLRPAALADETLATVTIAAAATVLTTAIGVAVAYGRHLHRGAVVTALARLGTFGYAVPGTVLAIGALPVLALVDRAVEAAGALAGASWVLFTLGSGAGVVYVCVARFLTIAVGSVEAGLTRIAGSLDDAARTLGAGAGRRLGRIYLPLTRPAILTAATLVFVDCMKELPATLLLRPIGVETLATHLYGEAVRGTYESGAVAALLIVAVGLIPVVLLARMSRAPVTAASAPDRPPAPQGPGR